MKLLKRILCITTLMLAIIMVPNGQQTEAADVWVAHWNSEGIDVYVMDDTLSHGTNSTGRWFSISTKMVKWS